MVTFFSLIIYNFFCFYINNSDAVYITMPPAPVAHYHNGEIIALAIDKDGEIIASAVSEGTLPEGLSLADNGTILVVDHTKLVPGSYPLEIVTVDEKEGMTTHQLEISFLVSGRADREAQYKAFSPKPIAQYKNTDVLMQPVDSDGAITDVRWIRGTVPPGTTIKKDGKIVVVNPDKLVSGNYNMQLITYDEAGGATLFGITLTLPEKVETQK